MDLLAFVFYGDWTRVGDIEGVDGIPLPTVVHYESVEAISTLNRIDFNLSDSRFD